MDCVFLLRKLWPQGNLVDSFFNLVVELISQKMHGTNFESKIVVTKKVVAGVIL